MRIITGPYQFIDFSTEQDIKMLCIVVYKLTGLMHGRFYSGHQALKVSISTKLSTNIPRELFIAELRTYQPYYHPPSRGSDDRDAWQTAEALTMPHWDCQHKQVTTNRHPNRLTLSDALLTSGWTVIKSLTNKCPDTPKIKS